MSYLPTVARALASGAGQSAPACTPDEWCVTIAAAHSSVNEPKVPRPVACVTFQPIISSGSYLMRCAAKFAGETFAMSLAVSPRMPVRWSVVQVHRLASFKWSLGLCLNYAGTASEMSQNQPTEKCGVCNILVGLVCWSCTACRLYFRYEPEGREFESLGARHRRDVA